ncbi:MAG: M23 family metallopeptidase [Bacteriovoracaceae bacterium]
MMKGLLFVTVFLTLLTGCSSIQSGSYVYFNNGDTLSKLAKKYGVTLEELRLANNGRKLVPGAWLFIPAHVGVIPQMYFKAEYADFFGGDGEFMWPVPTRQKISSEFGRRGGKNHDGIDIPGPIGTEIVASESGKVVYSGSGIRGYGNLTIVSHKDNYFSVYAHASKNLKAKGDKVKRGELIALMGNTGRSSGPHLHFEIRKKSNALNPIAFMSKEKKRIIASN